MRLRYAFAKCTPRITHLSQPCRHARSIAGLTVDQSERMVEEFHVYMLNSGRINVAGLNEATVPILADAIYAVKTTSPTA